MKDFTYAAAMRVKTQQEAKEFLEALLQDISEKFGGTPESHRATQLSNIGYFTGYYDAETAERVVRLFGCEHPIFGRSRPTTDEAFDAGKRIGRRMKERA